jgi:quaternary ammonium compound-resistance protein SugE
MVKFYKSRVKNGNTVSTFVCYLRYLEYKLNLENTMDWVYLIIAGLLEVIWASTLKYTDGFTKLVPSLITISTLTTSFILLAQALKTLPIGTGYAVWTGIGVVGTAIVGSVFLGESRDLSRFICITLIMLGIIGLRFTGSK